MCGLVLRFGPRVQFTLLSAGCGSIARLASGVSPAHVAPPRALSSAMAFAALQEGVFKCACARVLCCAASATHCTRLRAHTPAVTRRIDGFRFGGWMTFVTSAWFCVCSGLELLVSGDTQRRGSWRVRCCAHA